MCNSLNFTFRSFPLRGEGGSSPSSGRSKVTSSGGKTPPRPRSCLQGSADVLAGQLLARCQDEDTDAIKSRQGGNDGRLGSPHKYFSASVYPANQ